LPPRSAGEQRAAERLALALQASLVVRFSPPAVADAFRASRLEGDWGRAFGTLPPGVDTDSVITACG
jgi:putative acyl-CoA dehydrogenase